jgi:Resolvase, N terminal domain
VSGVLTDHKALAKAISVLQEGRHADRDAARLAGSVDAGLAHHAPRGAKKGAGFKSLADTWADTTTPHGRLMLTIIGGLAEFERDFIRARTSEGRAGAKPNGVHMGRPAKLTPHQRAEALERLDRGDMLTSAGLMGCHARPLLCSAPSAASRASRREAA